jgi:hypothetical protein
MVLLVALDHWKVDKEEVVETPGAGILNGSLSSGMPGSTSGTAMFGESVPKKDENAFRYFVSKMVGLLQLLP